MQMIKTKLNEKSSYDIPIETRMVSFYSKPVVFLHPFPVQEDRLCDEISGFVEYGFDIVQQGGT